MNTVMNNTFIMELINIYIRVINLYISILEENLDEIIEIINFVLEFNSNIGIEEGLLFKITGNKFVISFINGLISKTIVNRKIKYEPSLLGEILFDIYETRGIKYKNGSFIINKIEFEVFNDYIKLYFLIARLRLNDDGNDLIKEFENKIKKSDIQEFNFYFSKREVGLFEKIDTDKIKELSKFKNLIKTNGFYYKDYYDYNEFETLFKNKLENFALKEQKKLNQEKKKIMSKLSNNNLTDIFYSFVVLEKYRLKKDTSEQEKEHINRFLSEEQNTINKFNQEFRQNSFQETVKYIINQGMANPNEEEFDNVLSRLKKYYEKKDFTNNSMKTLEKYLTNNGIIENKTLKDKLNQNNHILAIKNNNDLNIGKDKSTLNDEFNVFSLLDILKTKNSESTYTILQYLKKEANLELKNILKMIYSELEDILGNSYLLYIISFFYDLKPEFELLQGYYIKLLDNGIIDQFYTDEWQKDDFDEENLEEFFEDDEVKSIEEEFIISTNDFLEEWSSYYKLFRTNILQNEDNLKLINLMVLSKDWNNLKVDKNILNLKLLTNTIFNEINEVIDILHDLKFLNDHLENLKDKEMKKQYDDIRKFINKWIRNINSFKRLCKLHLVFD
ncbi:MAG: hypothetical protein LBR15_05215 [Methanobrevibacter sp.]|jgi:hypothetical protein|nr:hypothetical protein [Candidatus Methanovirga australis]